MVKIKKFDESLAAIIASGRDMLSRPGITAPIATAFAENEISLFGLSNSTTSITYFVIEDMADKAFDLVNAISKETGIESIGLRKNIGLLVVNLSEDEWMTPGILAQITTSLSETGINIMEVTTSKPQILIYLERNDLDRAFDILKRIYE